MFERRFKVTRQVLNNYITLSGDCNPIHQGEDAIVHGALIYGYISQTVWQALGDGTRVFEVTSLRFQRALKLEETFIVSVPESSGKRIQRSEVRVTLENKEIVAIGHIGILSPKQSVSSQDVAVALSSAG